MGGEEWLGGEEESGGCVFLWCVGLIYPKQNLGAVTPWGVRSSCVSVSGRSRF